MQENTVKWDHRVQASGDLYHRWVTRRFLKRNMLTFHYLPGVTGADIEPTPEQLEKRVMRLLVSLGRETGHYIPMEGVLAPEDKEDDGTPGWPHVHLVLQEELPESILRRLKRLSRYMWVKVSYSDHPPRHRKEEETDLREYVANHMLLQGAVYLAGTNVRKRKSRSEQRATAPRATSRPLPPDLSWSG